MSAILLPKSVNGTAFPIVAFAEILILVIADPLLFDGTVIVAILFHGIITLIAHRWPPAC